MELQLIKKIDCVVDGRYLVSSEGIVSERYIDFLEKIYYLDFYEYLISDNGQEITVGIEDVLYIDSKTYEETYVSLALIYDKNLDDKTKESVFNYISDQFINGNIQVRSESLVISYESNKEKHEIKLKDN